MEAEESFAALAARQRVATVDKSDGRRLEICRRPFSRIRRPGKDWEASRRRAPERWVLVFFRDLLTAFNHRSSLTRTLAGIIQSLQHLHDELQHYSRPPVVRPRLESIKPAKRSVFSSLFGASRDGQRDGLGGGGSIPADLPRGLYLYGDVGSGKTMLMDLFYETLPASVESKTRIHFHNFMQDVHKRLHRVKMEHGSDCDAVPLVAADIAEGASVLCFDEFQCTDVADAMILRR